MWVSNMWPSSIWPSSIWPNYNVVVTSGRIIVRSQEIYKPTEYVSANATILGLNILSDVITITEIVTTILCPDSTITTQINNLIESSFVTAEGIKADLDTIKQFAYDLDVLLNSTSPFTVVKTGTSRVISRSQEIYEPTEFISSSAVIFEVNLYSDIISIMERLVDIMVENTTIASSIKSLIESEFIVPTGVNADLPTLKTFAYSLDELLNS